MARASIPCARECGCPTIVITERLWSMSELISITLLPPTSVARAILSTTFLSRPSLIFGTDSIILFDIGCLFSRNGNLSCSSNCFVDSGSCLCLEQALSFTYLGCGDYELVTGCYLVSELGVANPYQVADFCSLREK